MPCGPSYSHRSLCNPQRKFVTHLLPLLLAQPGRTHCSDLSRFGDPRGRMPVGMTGSLDFAAPESGGPAGRAPIGSICGARPSAA